MRRYSTENKGASFQELIWNALSFTSLELRSSSTKKPKHERSCNRYVKGALHVHLASSVGPLLAGSSDSALGSRMLALSGALTAITKPRTNLLSRVPMDSVNYFGVCLNRTHVTSMCPLIDDAKAFICKRNANVRENCLCNARNVEKMWALKNWNPKNNRHWSPCRQKQTVPKASHWWFNSLVRVYVLLPSLNLSLSDLVKPCTPGNVRKN